MSFYRELLVALESRQPDCQEFDEALMSQRNRGFTSLLKKSIFSLAKVINRAQPYFKIEKKNYLGKYLDNGFLMRCEKVYDRLSDPHSQSQFAVACAFRILSSDANIIQVQESHYKNYLRVVNDFNQKPINKSAHLSHQFTFHQRDRLDSKLKKINLNPLGLTLTFLNQQYNYQDKVSAEPGDTVLDIGACYGDTSLYFSSRVGTTGKVLAFEFIPSNLVEMRENFQFNPELASRISVIEKPVWSESDVKFQYVDKGPGSTIAIVDRDYTGSDAVSSVAIDDLRSHREIASIDFIKMDIEGAEMDALKGCAKAILEDRPKLAICVYHKFDHMFEVFEYIDSINPDYEYYFDFYTSIGWEMVLYAVPKTRCQK